MANDQPPDMSNEYARLASFGGNTIDVAAVTSSATGFVDLRYNSPMKMAKAGFYCIPGSDGNVLSCFACSAHWENPQGESPMAIHRAMNPNCPYLKSATPSSSSSPFVIPRCQIENVRRCLFTDDNQEVPFTSKNNNYLIKFQNYQDKKENGIFSPIGGSDFLFERRRFLTYDNLTHCSENLSRASEWAKNGFIFQGSNIVQCVFCALCLPFNTELPKFWHEQKATHCPFVSNIDIGNITTEMENTMNLIKQSQMQRQPSVERELAFIHPQYVSVDLRLETFREWSPQIYQTPDVLSEAGFYFTGCADKVICFCCGLGLKKWRGQADPWIQHARLSSECAFVKEIKGNNFVQDAQQAEVQVDFDPPKSYQEGQVTSNGTVTTTSPVSAGLNLDVVKAALECQYSMPQIRQAILNIHNLTCGFPNFPLLIGELQNQEHCQVMIQQQRLLQQEKERERQRAQQLVEENEMERQRAQQLVEENEMERQEKERERQEKQQLEQDQQQMYANVLRMAQERQTWQEKFTQEEERRRQEEERRRQEEERRRQEEERRRQQEADLCRQEQELQRLRAEIIRLNQGQQAAQENAVAPPPLPVNNLAPQCKICCQEPATALFLPCAHLCCCVQCSQHFLMKPCPVCRQHVQERKIVYVA